MAISDTDKFLVRRNGTSYWMSALDFANSFDLTYNLTDSLRFRSSSNAYLDRTQLSGNQQKWTFSAWVKRGAIDTYSVLMAAHKSGVTELTEIYFHSDNSLYVALASGTQAWYRKTNRLCRDTSAWYHVVGSVDTTNDSIRVWVNNEETTAGITGAGSFTNFNTHFNSSTAACSIGRRPVLNNWHFDGYMTEINFVDGQALTPSDFGEIDAATGVWKPKKYTGSYGTNGFYLDMSTSGSTVTDQSGNGNDWTATNMNLTTSTATTYDKMSDVPTLTDEDTGNFATLNPLAGTKNTISEGNLKYSGSTGGDYHRPATLAASSGKWYFEVKATAIPGDYYVGISEISNNGNYDSVSVGNASNGLQYAIYSSSGGSVCSKVNNGFTATSLSKAVNGDIIQIAFDLDNNKFWFGINNTWADSGNPSTGANSLFTITAGTYAPALTLSGAGVSTTLEANFGQRPFAYTPPTGYKKLNTYNLPDSAVVDGSQYMNNIVYSGQNTSLALTGFGFSPDFVWAKRRNSATNHILVDTIRGGNVFLSSNTTSADTTSSGLVTFDSDGVTWIGGASGVNESGGTYVNWSWRGSDSTAVSNSDGSIASTVSANTTSGFSVVTYTGTGSVATIGHGLGVAPSFIIVKPTNISGAWKIYHSSLGATQAIEFTTGTSATNSVYWNNTAPTNFVFTAGTAGAINSSGNNHVAYCFAEVEGFSKFGSYTGNGSTDGPFIYTGFRPAFVLSKRTDAGGGWVILDTARDTYNIARLVLQSEGNYAEASVPYKDILSNGFKIRSSTVQNASSATYIYMAFAENPFKNSLAR